MSTIKVTNLQNASAASPAIVLDANSRATLNGLSYPTEGSLSGRNRIINGDMRIDQRNAGASVTPANNDYLVDRWQAGLSQSSKYTAQQSTTAPTGFSNSLKITSSSAYTVGASDYFVIQHKIEAFNTGDLAWGTASAKSVTLSFYVYSSLTGTFGGVFTNSATDRSYPFTYTISAANTWEQKTVTVAGDTSGTWLKDTNGIGVCIRFGLGVGSTYSGTAGAWSGSLLLSATGATSVVGTNGATFYITGVQLEAGSVATPFERRSFGQELALCQRYYEQSYADGVAPGTVTSVGQINQATFGDSTGTHTVSNDFIVPKRANPTITIYYPGSLGASGSVQVYAGSYIGGAAISVQATTARLEVASFAYSVGGASARKFHYVANAEL